jgi:hypothetical protein
MASGHVYRANRPNTWLLRPMLQSEDSSCQPGAVHTWPISCRSQRRRLCWLQETHRTSVSTARPTLLPLAVLDTLPIGGRPARAWNVTSNRKRSAFFCGGPPRPMDSGTNWRNPAVENVQCRDSPFCAGFRTPGSRKPPHDEVAGGRKAPRHEVAGSWARAKQRAL